MPILCKEKLQKNESNRAASIAHRPVADLLIQRTKIPCVETDAKNSTTTRLTTLTADTLQRGRIISGTGSRLLGFLLLNRRSRFELRKK